VLPGKPKKKRDWGQRYIGFGPRIGPFHGFGAGVRAGHPYVGADISGGWQPIWVILQKQYIGSSASPDLEFEGAHSGQLSAGAYVSFNPGKRFVAGLNAGYRFNSVLGHGFAIGFDGLLNLSRLLALQFNVGPLVFPDGDDRFKAEVGLPSNVSFDFPRPAVQIGIGVGLMIFP